MRVMYSGSKPMPAESRTYPSWSVPSKRPHTSLTRVATLLICRPTVCGVFKSSRMEALFTPDG